MICTPSDSSAWREFFGAKKYHAIRPVRIRAPPTVATSLTFMPSNLRWKTGCFTIRMEIACRASRAVPATAHLWVFRPQNAEADMLDGVAHRAGPQLGPARHDQWRLTTRDEVHGHYRHTREGMDILKDRGHAGLAHHSFDRVHRCTHRHTL